MSSKKKASIESETNDLTDEYDKEEEEDYEDTEEEEYNEDEDEDYDEDYDEDEGEDEEEEEEEEDDEGEEDNDDVDEGNDDDEEGDDEYEYGGDEEEDVVDGDDIGIDDPDDVNLHKQAVRVPDDERITTPIITKYEVPRIIGIRTAQLAKGANPLISNVQNKSPVRIAIDELLLKKTPMKIKRPMPYPAYEIWKISELEIVISQDDIDDLILAIK